MPNILADADHRAGGHHVGVAIVHRGPSANVVAGTIHSEVTEVYTSRRLRHIGQRWPPDRSAAA